MTKSTPETPPVITHLGRRMFGIGPDKWSAFGDEKAALEWAAGHPFKRLYAVKPGWPMERVIPRLVAEPTSAKETK